MLFAQLSFPVALHLICAVVSLGLLIPIAFSRRGTSTHRRLGRAWMGAMLLTALSSFGIRTIGGLGFGFSVLHLLALWTLISLAYGLWAIRAGRVRAHRSTMVGLASGLVIAFLFTFLPGRVLGEAARSLLGVRPAAAADAPAPVATSSVTVRVIGAPDPQALINIGLFARPEDPAKGVDPVFRAQLPAVAGGATAGFFSVPAGRWTVAAFQDLNGDGRLGRNFLGLPNEPAALGGTVTLGASPVTLTLDLSR